MADIQPKNTDTIRVNVIKEKTSSAGITLDNTTKVDSIVEKISLAGVSLNSVVKVTTGLVPLAATLDIGTSTGVEHIRELYAKEITSNGQDLSIGTDSAHSLVLKSGSGGLSRVAIESDGDVAQDATNGGNLLWTKSSTGLALKHSNTLTAAGTTIADALVLIAVYNVLTTVAASSGAKLWDAPIGTMVIVVNAGANALALYPHSVSGTINGGGGGSSVSIATAALAICIRDTANNWIAREIAAPAA